MPKALTFTIKLLIIVTLSALSASIAMGMEVKITQSGKGFKWDMKSDSPGVTIDSDTDNSSIKVENLIIGKDKIHF